MSSSAYVLRVRNNITIINSHIFNMQQQTIAGLALKHFVEKESRVPEGTEGDLRSDAPDIELKDVSLTL